jgi:hypothetical protein
MKIILALNIIAIVAMITAIIAMLFARRAITLASLEIERVSSSRASRLAAEAASRSDCFSASQADACAPISPPLAASTRVAVSPFASNAARCGRSRVIYEIPDFDEAVKLANAYYERYEGHPNPANLETEEEIQQERLDFIKRFKAGDILKPTTTRALA